MKMTHTTHILKRGKWYHFKRRVPSEIKGFYDADFVQVSLKTDSYQLAMQRAAIFNTELERIWADSVIFGQGGLDHKLEKAKRIARLHGFSYLTASQIAEINVPDIVERVHAVKDAITEEPEKIEAILGKHDDEGLVLSKALDYYFRFEKASHHNKSPHQIKKWKNPRIRAVDNFIALHGDLPINSIKREHILALREWWHDRIQYEGKVPGTANKDFTHLRSLLGFVCDDKQLDMNVEHLFTRMRFTNVASKRPPFSPSYIENTLLHLDNLEGLHHEAKLFLFAMADTGARPSELLGLNYENGDICLDHDIPHIYIRPEKDKALKTAQSERQIPLVGASLFAFKNLPEGFKHYYRKSDQLSGNLNKFLRDHDLLPTEEHSIYSLRHSFEDRLTAAEPPEKVQAALMGHKYSRPRYGDGPSLEQKKKWLDMICFKV